MYNCTTWPINIGRIFSYPDTQFHRLGPNFMKLPVNCPFRVNNTQLDGLMRFDGNEDGAPPYHPNSFNGPIITGHPDSRWSIENAIVARFESGDEDNYSQPAIMWSQVRSNWCEMATARFFVDLLIFCLPNLLSTRINMKRF